MVEGCAGESRDVEVSATCSERKLAVSLVESELVCIVRDEVWG